MTHNEMVHGLCTQETITVQDFAELIRFTLDANEEVIYDGWINVYVPIWFDADKAFGLDLNSEENADWINMYIDWHPDDTIRTYISYCNNSTDDPDFNLEIIIIKFISEGNVYRLICRSNKPEAEKFETWVFDELLPRIRQTGGYVNDPVVFVDNWLPNTDAKTKALLVTSLEAVKNQDNIIGVQQESVEFHRAVSASVNSVDFGEFAKCLANDRISIGRNRLMAWLRKEKYIDSANVAYQRYIDQEIFEVKETVYYVGTTYHTSRKTLITPKGQVYLAKKVSKEYKG